MVNFWQSPSSPPIHLQNSPAFLAIVERVHGHFSTVQAQTEWQFAVTTASSVKALVATRQTASSSINSNTKESSGPTIIARGTIDSNVGVSSNVGRIQEQQEESSSSDSSPCKPVKKPRLSGPRTAAECQPEVEQAQATAVEKAVIRRQEVVEEVRIATLDAKKSEVSL